MMARLAAGCAAQTLGEPLNGQINRLGKFPMPERGADSSQDGKESLVGEMTIERVADGQPRLFGDGIDNKQCGMLVEPAWVRRLKCRMVQQPKSQLRRGGGTRQHTEIHREENLGELPLEILQAVMEKVLLLAPQAMGCVCEGVQTDQIAAQQFREGAQVQAAMPTACCTFGSQVGASWAFHVREII